MIPFKPPEVSMSISEYMEIVEAQNEAGAAVGFFVGLGRRFFSSGVTTVDGDIIPALTERAQGVCPRVIPSYAILLWFTLEVYGRTYCK